MEIEWTKFALEDLQGVYDYIAKDSKFYADRFINKLVDRVDILFDNEKAGRVVPEFENELIRELIEGNYRIIYKIESFNEVWIVRIHHTARLLKDL